MARYADLPKKRRIHTNAKADGTLLDEVAAPDPEIRALLVCAAERLRLLARGYHRVMRVARTLADLEGAAIVDRRHITEALCYRRQRTLLESAARPPVSSTRPCCSTRRRKFWLCKSHPG